MNYKYLLWDLDGTLINSKKGIINCLQYALERLSYPCPPEDELDWIIGPPLSSSFSRLLQTDDSDLVEEAVRLYRERYGVKGMYEHEVFPGIAELLQDLSEAGYVNLLATSKAKFYADQILDHFHLSRYFTGGLGSELNGNLREKDELIRAVLKQIPQAEKQECIMIGDRYFDIWGAKENGIDVIAVEYGYGDREELEKAGPTYQLTKVADLRTFFLS